MRMVETLDMGGHITVMCQRIVVPNKAMLRCIGSMLELGRLLNFRAVLQYYFAYFGIVFAHSAVPAVSAASVMAG